MPDRRDERIDAILAVVLEQRLGVTRNVSASGVYFENRRAAHAGRGVQLRRCDHERKGLGFTWFLRGELK